MRKFDKDQSGRIAFPEFLSLAKSLVGTKKDWKESMAVRVATAILMKTAIFPFVATAMKSGLVSVGAGNMAGLPVPVLSSGLEMASKFLFN